MEICTFLETFKNEIQNELKQLPLRCNGKCANGKQCSFNSLTNSRYCKKHQNSTYVERVIPVLTYHNHLPGIYVKTCLACQTVGINS